jgi:hypothetical protein
MADFVQKSDVKTATRVLTTPIDTIANFNTLVSDFITNNPLGCTSYESAAGTIAGVVRGAENYSGKVIYEDGDAKTVGQITVRGENVTAFNSNIATVLSTAALGTAFGGSPSHDSSGDTFSCATKLHFADGEKCVLTFKRDSVTLSSYEDNAHLTALETWADTITALA